MSFVKSAVFALVCASMVAVSAPARAYDGYGSHIRVGFHSGYGAPHYRPHYRHHHYRHHGRYDRRYRHKHRGVSGGEAALIAAGVIGGILLIDHVLDEKSREPSRRYPAPYGARGYDDRYASADQGWRFEADRRRFEADRRRFEAERAEFERERAEFERARRNESRKPHEGEGFDGDEDFGLKGGSDADLPSDAPFGEASLGQASRGQPSLGQASRGQASLGAGAVAPQFVQSAFEACARRVRFAADDRRLTVALPARPKSVKSLDDGVILLTVPFTMQSFDAADPTRRTMHCEADIDGVLYLEVD